MTSGVILEWKFKPGEAFNAGDSLAEVQTDKASIDFECTDGGVMGTQFVSDGAEVNCGDAICITLEEDEEWDTAAFADFPVPTGGVSAAAAVADPAPTATPPNTTSTFTPTHTPTTTTISGGRIIASPLAKTLARNAGIDLSRVVGLGPNGRILAADVEEYVVSDPSAGQLHQASSPSTHSQPPSPPISGENFIDYPTTISDQQTAANLLDSKVSERAAKWLHPLLN